MYDVSFPEISMRVYVIIAILAVLVTGDNALADTVRLSSGEVINGKIEKMDKDNIFLKSPYGREPLGIARTLVTDITIDGRTLLMFPGEKKIEGTLQSAGPGRYKLVDDKGGTSDEFSLADIEMINPPSDAPQTIIKKNFASEGGSEAIKGNSDVSTERMTAMADFAYTKIVPKEKTRTDFSFELGGLYSSEKVSESDLKNARFKSAYKYTWASSAVSALGQYYYAETSKSVTGRSSLGELRYDYFIGKKMSLFALDNAEYDFARTIDLRNKVAIGVSYKFIDDPKMTLETNTGMAYQSTKYRDHIRDNERAVPLYLVVKFKWLFLDKFELNVNNEYYPNSQDINDYNGKTDLSLKWFFMSNIYFSSGVVVNYDSIPMGDREYSDVRQFFTVGVKF